MKETDHGDPRREQDREDPDRLRAAAGAEPDDQDGASQREAPSAMRPTFITVASGE